MSNDFAENFFFGTKKYRHLLEALYKQYSYDGRYVFIDKSRFSTLVQQRLKTDTVIQKDVEASNGIEEKVVAWPVRDYPYTAFFLETKSCTNLGHESDGWMHTCQADYLLYAFEIKDIGLDIYIVDFPLLQQWFWEDDRYARYKWHRMPDQNRTLGHIVNIHHVTACIPTERFLIYFDGTTESLKTTVNIARYRDHILNQRTQQRIKQALTAIPHKEEEGEWAFIDNTDEEEGDWREVQQRVEEILAVRDLQDYLKWVEEQEARLEQSSLKWEDDL